MATRKQTVTPAEIDGKPDAWPTAGQLCQEPELAALGVTAREISDYVYRRMAADCPMLRGRRRIPRRLLGQIVAHFERLAAGQP